MLSVKSSQLVAVGFHEGELVIQFHPRRGAPEGTKGPVYAYRGDSARAHYDALLAAEADPEQSVGSYFIRSVKVDKDLLYRKLDADPAAT